MTVSLKGGEIAEKITDALPDSIIEADEKTIVADSKSLYKVAEFLKETPGFEFDYLANLTAVDYVDYFEIVYNLFSLGNNHSIVLKTRCLYRDEPTVPSVVSLWRTAYYQEQELYDLMGITFGGHPNLKRLFLWEGFPGHPLRRDYL